MHSNISIYDKGKKSIISFYTLFGNYKELYIKVLSKPLFVIEAKFRFSEFNFTSQNGKKNAKDLT